MHNLIEFLENTSRQYGNRIAVESADGSLSFAQLRSEALRIAVALCAVTRRRNGEEAAPQKEKIAVYLPRGSQCLCAMLGVLYGGGAYIPLDTRAPVNRTKRMLGAVAPRLVITDQSGRQFLSAHGVPESLLVDCRALTASETPVPNGFVEETLAKTQDTDPAYLLFTSGSTGVPKGVVIPHRRVINYIRWARDFFSVGSGEIVGNQAPFYFTVSAMDIYLCLATGSKLHIIPEGCFSQPVKLLRLLEEKKITLIFWVASVYHHVAKADALARLRPSFLRRAWFVGEPMPAASLSYWMERLPDVAFANLYGSTETDMTLCYPVPRGLPMETVPLGTACANTEVLLIKEDLTPAGDGEIGEICVRGSCLALGYFQSPEKTGDAFVQNPLHNDYPDRVYRTGDLGERKDGLILFHGRRDHQFKHLGYRIEAGEIETVAARYPGIQNACVLYDGGRRQIVLFYEAEGQVDELACRAALMADLPVYMIPTRFVRLSAMPLTASRKKDRVLLKSTYIQNQEGE